ncbi:hypothetical protein Barb6_01995 [Bacteroidales bacterium Barb6]|nr:hypothetical protein Barb6_01995 [Bacteroidales bacterium Barb6]
MFKSIRNYLLIRKRECLLLKEEREKNLPHYEFDFLSKLSHEELVDFVEKRLSYLEEVDAYLRTKPIIATPEQQKAILDAAMGYISPPLLPS